MSSNAITIPGVQIDEKPWVDTLHEWLTTVDHKRLGILYIVYALLFLVVAGVEALIIRIQLMYPHNRFCFAAGLQSHVHDAWHDHGFLRGHANPVWVCELSCAIDDRRSRHGVSAAECLQFLAFGAGWISSLLQPGGRKWALRRRQRAGRGMVGVRSADRAGVFPRPQLGLLDAVAAGFRIWKHRNRNQYHRDHFVPALPGNEAQPHALAGMAQPGDVGNGSDHDHSAIRGADHVAGGSLSRRPFLRCAGGRLGRAVDALLLDLRPSGGVRPDHSLLRVHVGNHPGVFPQTDFRISGDGRRRRSASPSSA